MTGSVTVFLCALLVMFGVVEQLSAWGAILALPVAANEMILAVWLIFKGFNESALAPTAAQKHAGSSLSPA